MLDLPTRHCFDKRSTGKISAKGMRPLIDILESSATLFRFDRERARAKGALKYTATQMITITMFIEIKKLTYDSYETLVHGRGGQRILKNLGMPVGPDGRYLAPSRGWISTFRNHEYSFFRYDLEREMQDSILQRFREGGASITLTMDSSPLEASRYSEWADFNPHYNIKMAKAHIMMIRGIPLFYTFTNGNVGDCPEFMELLDRYDGVLLKGARILSDGSYASHEAYLKVFRKTGVVMSSNLRYDAVFHEEATYDKLVRAYNKLHKEPDFVPLKHTNPDHMLRYLSSHGYAEKVGWFLRNLDLSRGDRIHREDSLKRHVCETVHRAMKRWVDLDVRGLHKKYVGKHLQMKMFICTMLCFVFEPYC